MIEKLDENTVNKTFDVKDFMNNNDIQASKFLNKPINHPYTSNHLQRQNMSTMY